MSSLLDPVWSINLRWPRRLSGARPGLCFKRDPGAFYGQPDLVWVWRMAPGRWRIHYDPAEGTPVTPPTEFKHPWDAMDEADRLWPVQTVN